VTRPDLASYLRSRGALLIESSVARSLPGTAVMNALDHLVAVRRRL